MRKILLLLACGLILVTSSGCSTKEQLVTIYPADKAGSKLPVEVGQFIDIHTKQKIRVDIYEEAEAEYPNEKMISELAIEVIDSNPTSIRGKLINIYAGAADKYIYNHSREDNIVEVKLEDIEYIGIWEKPLTLSSRGIEMLFEIFGLILVGSYL